MYYLIYASAAVKAFTEDQIIELLAKSRENNSRRNITGLLLYKDGSFLQVLEGEKDVVRQLYDTIACDRRHHMMTVIHEGHTDQRQFPDWTMGFRNLDSADIRARPGYNTFLQAPLTSEKFTSNPSVCRGLLHLFKITM